MKKRFLCIVAAVLLLVFTGTACGESAWQSAYQNAILTGDYAAYIHAPNAVFTEEVYSRDKSWDLFALCDINQDGIPELLVRIDYGVEQADVFTYENGRVLWKGTIGGDNFFQAVLCYEEAGLPGAIYALMGGPGIEIDEYRLVEAGVVKRVMGYTLVDEDGMTLPAVEMLEQDPVLEQLIVSTLEENTDGSEYLEWLNLSDLQGEPGWSAFFGE